MGSDATCIRRTRFDDRRGLALMTSLFGVRIAVGVEWPPRLSFRVGRLFVGVASGDRWPSAIIGTRWRCWGLGEWQSDANWTVAGWGPFWRSVRDPVDPAAAAEIPPPPPSLPWPPQWGPNPWRKS